MGDVKNAFHDEIERNAYFDELAPNEESECEACDGFGRCWKHCDPTSGQWIACDDCNDTRGHP